jgi:hypothetical protein
VRVWAQPDDRPYNGAMRAQHGEETGVTTVISSEDPAVVVPARLWEHLQELYAADERARLESTRQWIAERRQGVPAAQILNDR